MRLIEGIVEVPIESTEDLEAENAELRRELQQARMETQQARRDSSRALSALRKQLNPLYQALRAVFGEIDASGVEMAEELPQTNARVSAVWESWKSRVGSSSKVIDALLLHGEMNTGQLAVATGFHRTTIPAHIFKLNKLGLINKNGGRFSLKKL